MSCVVPFFTDIQRFVLTIEPNSSVETLKMNLAVAFEWPVHFALDTQFFTADSLPLPDETVMDFVCKTQKAQQGVRVRNPRFVEANVALENRFGNVEYVKIGSYMGARQIRERVANAFDLPFDFTFATPDGKKLPVLTSEQLLANNPSERLKVLETDP